MDVLEMFALSCSATLSPLTTEMFKFPEPDEAGAACGDAVAVPAVIGTALAVAEADAPLRPLPLPPPREFEAFDFAELPFSVIAPKTGPEFPSAPTCWLLVVALELLPPPPRSELNGSSKILIACQNVSPTKTRQKRAHHKTA